MRQPLLHEIGAVGVVRAVDPEAGTIELAFRLLAVIRVLLVLGLLVVMRLGITDKVDS